MSMKQTQTKLFDFSDAGLNLCVGSRSLFPDRYKKMLSLGYNEQTVLSVSVMDNQVTFHYGGAHGYNADRVLKVDSGALSLINGGEFWIDSVTTDTITFTLDDAPVSFAGGFVTKIAPLGWELVYENGHIHIYKFQHIDETDMYARLCFQNLTSNSRNCIAVGIGKTVDLDLGHITDPNCLSDLATCGTVAQATSNLRWDYTYDLVATFNSYTYSQGYSTFGQSKVFGSKYHFIHMYHTRDNTSFGPYMCGILPFSNIGYDNLDYPALLCSDNGASSTNVGNAIQYGRIYVGSIRCTTSFSSDYIFNTHPSKQSFLPTSIDGFNTTTCVPLMLYENTTKQVLGGMLGLYQVFYASTNNPGHNMADFPKETSDIDLNHKIYFHPYVSSSTVRAHLAVVLEEVKIGL